MNYNLRSMNLSLCHRRSSETKSVYKKEGWVNQNIDKTSICMKAAFIDKL